MTNPIIIGISGKAGSGKDWVGENVLQPLGFMPFALSWHMKNEAVANGFSWTEMHVTKPAAARTYLQQRGTEEGWMRHGEDYWCTIAEAWMKTLAARWHQQLFYIPDVRFLHEIAWVKRIGGKLLRLEHGTRPYPLKGTPAARHSSEVGLDHHPELFDLVFYNDLGTLAEDVEYAMVQAGMFVAASAALELAAPDA